ncbi:MAG TPA: aminotransferase class I/II-fold pyridoxal phosphate-dependent enzyme [Oligoflexia bacterium]|nr:aminotransferase class I/II-fold pyridoxal phosphate-dependent enzyme [Oligoflexia bacterium]
MPTSGDFFRISQLPPYPLGEIAHAVRAAQAAGEEIIDLSQINPDLGPPAAAVDKLVQACLQPHNHRYSASQGITKLRAACASWYEQRFGVALDAASEIVVTMGTKEGLSHLLLAVVSPGDTVIVPAPSYPIHVSAVFISGASLVGLPLFSSYAQAAQNDYHLSAASGDFFDRLDRMYHNTWPRPKFIVLSFPHNPTATTVDTGFFQRLVEFALKNRTYIVHDFAYADLCFDGFHAPSILALPRAKEVAVEYYSLSKGFGMPGWRLGFCVGNPRLVSALKRIKSYLDSGVFQPLQIAALKLLDAGALSAVEYLRETAAVYQARRDVLTSGLTASGWELSVPRATVFVWARIPERFRSVGSLAFSRRLLENARVAACPGIGFDQQADEYLRFALVEPERKLRQAVERIGELS